MRLAADAVLASIGIFIALVVVSMATYPGGSWLAPNAQQHDLLRNFLCDLLGPMAINGKPNPVGSAAMIAAMVVLALGLGVLWWSMGRLFVSPRLSVAIRVCGTVSLLGLVAVPFTPPTVSYPLHAAAVFSGGGPAAAACVLSLIGMAIEPRTRPLAVLGTIAMVWVLIGFASYAQQYFGGSHPTIWKPISHRIATVFFVSWLVAIGLALKGVAKREAPPVAP